MQSGIGFDVWWGQIDSYEGGSQVSLFYSPRGHQDVLGFEFELLVVVHEARNRLVRREVLDL